MDNKTIGELSGPIRYQLTNDYMFRAVMQKSVNVLKHLICALLGIPVESVTDIEIMNPIILGEEINAKTCILDIRIRLNTNRYINVEMQVSEQEYWKERSLIYLCRLYDNLDAGQNYNEVLPAMQISILDFDLFDGVEELCSHYYLTNENPEYANRYSDDFGITVLNLRQIYNEKVLEKEGESDLYQWAQLFKAKSWEEIRMLAKKKEVFDECVYTMAKLSEEEKIRQQCEARLDAIAKENGVYSRGVEAGMKEGIKAGMSKGMEAGIRKGMKTGGKEKAREIARNLLNVLDVSTIAEKTGLTEEEIRKL